MSQVWWPIMAAGCVIGVDLGGTKLLAGTVDSKLEVHHRAYRLARTRRHRRAHRPARRGGRRRPARRRPRRCSRSGSGIPCLVDPATGVALDSNHLPLHGVAVRDVLAERLGLPVAVDNDGNAAMLAEWRLRRGARGAQRDHADARHRHRRRACSSTGALVHGARGAAAELGHIIVDADGPPCPGSCPNHGCLEALVSGHAIGAEGLRLAREAPDSALGRALDSGREITGALVTELAHDGDPAAARRDDADGRAPGPRRRRRWSTSSTPRSSSSAAARSRPASCCWPRRARSSRARALPVNRERRAPRAGPLRRRVRDARRGRAWPSTWRGWRVGMSGRLIVCPTPIGNLEDVTLRVLSALREADVIACEDTRTTKVLLDRYGVSAERVRYDAHAERRVAPRLVERMRAGRGRGAGQRRRDAARQRSGARARAGVHGGGARGRGAARAQRGAGRAGGVGHGGRDVALRGLPAAQEGRAGGGLRVARGGRGLRVAAPGGGVAGRAGGASTPSGRWRSAAS